MMEKDYGHKENWALIKEYRKWVVEMLFKFKNKVFGSKIKRFKYFQTGFELDSNWDNSNELFEDFSNLEILEIGLNIQI
jgi:hypothetical protein